MVAARARPRPIVRIATSLRGTPTGRRMGEDARASPPFSFGCLIWNQKRPRTRKVFSECAARCNAPCPLSGASPRVGGRPPCRAARRSRPARSRRERRRGRAGARERLAWADLDAATFARARAEERFVVIDGSAEWCHWCHVMEATTYHDPEVRKLLDAHFLAGEGGRRHAARLRGALRGLGLARDGADDAPTARRSASTRATSRRRSSSTSCGPWWRGRAATRTAVDAAEATRGWRARPLSEAEIAEAARSRAAAARRALGRERREAGATCRRCPLYWDNAWALARARAGDATARGARSSRSTGSAGSSTPSGAASASTRPTATGCHPHYEKLMTLPGRAPSTTTRRRTRSRRRGVARAPRSSFAGSSTAS